MLVVNDSMVLIHLAKITLLEKSCDFFGKVLIPEKVFFEVVEKGKSKGYEDAVLVEMIIKKNKINVKKVKRKALIEKANNFNVFGGEAEAVALYWQEQADLIITDDDNVRTKKELLEVNLVGTLSVILSLYKKKMIDLPKARGAVNKLRKIGWFNSEVLDRVLREVEENG